MAEGLLESQDFEKYITLSEKAAHDAAVKSNDAFILAMARAVKRGRENVKVGTYVDTSPPIGARRIYGDVIMSPCGSPSAMCAESGGAPGGAEALK